VSPLGYFLVSEVPDRSREATIPLVPRRTFFRNPDRTNVQISSDGAHLAWIEPVGGIQNVFVAPATDIRRGHGRLHRRPSDRSLATFGPTPAVTSLSCGIVKELKTIGAPALTSILAKK
jgi:hypothetical protein